MLACSRFKGKHTADKIQQENEETVSCFEIGHKVTNIVTNNATNMVYALNLSIPGFEIGSTASVDESKGYVNQLCNDTETSDDDCSDTFETSPKHTGCFAHTLQLVVRDGLNEFGGYLKQIISKASSIVSYVRKSTNASELLQDEKRIQAANSTRWNAQFYMLDSVLAVSEEKLNSLDCSHKLSIYGLKLFQELCTILQPFQEATLEIQRLPLVPLVLSVALTNQRQSISSI